MQLQDVNNSGFLRIITMIFKNSLEVRDVFVYSRLIVG